MSRPFRHPKSSKHWFRIGVPKDLREKIGKTEIRQSLRTTDLAEAQIQEAKLTAEWKERFRVLRQEAQEDQAAQGPELVDRYLNILADRRHGDADGVFYALQKLITLQLFAAWGPYEFKDRGADLALGEMLPPETWDVWGTDSDPAADVIPEGDRDQLIARMRILHRLPDTFGACFREAINYIKIGKRWDVLTAHVMLVGEFTGTKIPLGGPLFDSVAESLADRLIEHRSYRWNEPLIANLPAPKGVGGDGATEPAPISVPQVIAPPPEPRWQNAGPRHDPSQLLPAALEKWKELMAPGESAVKEASRAVSRFIQLYGDKPVAAITPNDVFDYRDFIKSMPAGIQLPAIVAAGQSQRDAVEAKKKEETEAEATARAKGKTPPKLRRLRPTSIKKDVGALSAIFAALISERWIISNPAERIPIDGYTKKGKRLPLRPDMMAKLFASPLFTGCKGPRDIDRTVSGPHVFQDALYWSFLFAATSGHRLNELCQVLLDDIGTVDGPRGQIAGIFVTGTGEAQSIKTDFSMRVIVVHPKLVQLGFLDYVEARRRAGATRLFDVSRQKLSQSANRYIDRVVTDNCLYVFHSMRHEFADRSEIDVSEEVSRKIMGHARRRLYGLGAPLQHAARELEKIDLSFIDWDRLMRAAGREAFQPSSIDILSCVLSRRDSRHRRR